VRNVDLGALVVDYTSVVICKKLICFCSWIF